MRFAISIVAALMILGLAALGIVSAQKMSASPSQTTAADSAAAATPQAAAAPARRHSVNPVSQIAQTAGNPAPAPAAAPKRMAETTQDGTRRAESGHSTAGASNKSVDPRRACRLEAAEACADGDLHSALRQAKRHGLGAHRGDRHHGRPRLRLRAFQAI